MAVVWYGTLKVILSYQEHIVDWGMVPMPLWIPQSVLPIGMFILALQYIVRIVEDIDKIKKSQMDQIAVKGEDAYEL